MNEDHYRRVKEVLDKIRELVRRASASGGLLAVERKFQREWNEAFPKDKGFGRSVFLDLRDADLSGGHFVAGATFFQRADLRGANLQQTYWMNTAIDQADLSEADLSGCSMAGIEADGAVMHRADLTGAKIKLLAINNPVDLTDAVLDRAKVQFTTITRLQAERASMSGTTLSIWIKNRGDKAAAKGLLDAFQASLSPQQREGVTLGKPEGPGSVSWLAGLFGKRGEEE